MPPDYSNFVLVMNKFEPLKNKILETIKELSVDLDLSEKEIAKVTQEITRTQFPLSSPKEMWLECANIISSKNIFNPDYDMLGGRLLYRWLEIQTPLSFSEFTKVATSPKGINKDYSDFVLANREVLDELANKKEYNFNYSSMKTLMQSYLYRIKGDVEMLELPSYMLLRVSTFLYYPEVDKIKELYEVLSSKRGSFSSPVYFNAATRRPSLFACFLISISDSLSDISDSWKKIALISMNKGGLGVDYSNLRHSNIGISGAKSRGIIPWIKIHNEVMGAVDQSSVRKGSSTIYLRDFHIDIEEFCELRKTTGTESMRARELFLAVLLSDLFMERVEKDEMWSLFCPGKYPKLSHTFGEDFRKRYEKYESLGKYERKIRARDLYTKLFILRAETGMPFIIFIDNVNRKNMQENIGMIRQSNLCTEIFEHTSEEELAACVLGNVCYPAHVKDGRIDWKLLDETVRIMIRALNQIIDRSFYPDEIPAIKRTNLKNRPLGLGVQGLADLFATLDLTWESEEARRLNYQLEERQYYSALRESCELAKKHGPYEAFKDSPYSRGLFHPDLTNIEGKNKEKKQYSLVSEEEINILRKDVVEHGIRNSLLRARMPTATSSLLFGNNESFEPFGHCIYTRKLISGQTIVVNRHLYRDIKKLCPDFWDDAFVSRVILDGGSIQNISFPIEKHLEKHLKEKYKTSFEVSQKKYLKFSLDVLRFVDQGSSINAFFDNPKFQSIYSWDMMSWKRGQKTCMYYLRRKPKENPLNFAALKLGESKNKRSNEKERSDERSFSPPIGGKSCSLEDNSCESCTC